jgi:hypothetical protein
MAREISHSMEKRSGAEIGRSQRRSWGVKWKAPGQSWWELSVVRRTTSVFFKSVF